VSKETAASNPLDAMNLGQLKTEVEAAMASVEALLAFAEKFSFLLPPAAKTGITELQSVLKLVSSFLAKV
jgi:hypothetical protein